VIEVFPPFLVFKLGYNTGINFGLMSGGPEVTRWMLVGIALAISAWLLWWARTGAHPAHRADLGGGGHRRGAGQRARPGADRGRRRLSQHVLLRDRRTPLPSTSPISASSAGAIGLLIFADPPKNTS
jgi:signal peptidase II